MKKFLRILNIWVHGKLSLCKRMKWNNVESEMYFAWYGKRATNKKQVLDFFLHLKNIKP